MNTHQPLHCTAPTISYLEPMFEKVLTGNEERDARNISAVLDDGLTSTCDMGMRYAIKKHGKFTDDITPWLQIVEKFGELRE